MKKVRTQLRSKGIFNSELLDEYEDHFITKYETLLDIGLTKETAFAHISEEINKINGFRITSQHIFLHHKYKLIMITFLFSLAIYFFASNSLDSDPPSISPVKSDIRITSGYGERLHPITREKVFHKGMDIKGQYGDEVVAPSDGIIIESGYHDKLGHYIVIQHDDVYSSRFHHLSLRSVEINQAIKKGEKIGEVGSSGVSSGPHLHYEVLVNGQHVDLSSYLRA